MSLLRLLAWFPPELLPLVLIGGALLVILSLLKPAVLLRTVVILAFLPVVFSLLEGVLVRLPAPLLFVVVVVGGLWVLRAVASLALGSAAATHMVGALAADAVRALIRLIILPFRIIGWTWRG